MTTHTPKPPLRVVTKPHVEKQHYTYPYPGLPRHTPMRRLTEQTFAWACGWANTKSVLTQSEGTAT
jgi:hypothetical protein